MDYNSILVYFAGIIRQNVKYFLYSFLNILFIHDHINVIHWLVSMQIVSIDLTLRILQIFHTSGLSYYIF